MDLGIEERWMESSNESQTRGRCELAEGNDQYKELSAR